jgi:hypothetical protein
MSGLSRQIGQGRRSPKLPTSLGGDVDLEQPLDVLVFGRPREGGDGVAERDAAVESGPEVGGAGERVYVIR